jgi:hypothetical protein
VLTEVGPIQLSSPAIAEASSSLRSSLSTHAGSRGQRGHRVALGQGLTTGGIRAHLTGIYGVDVSRDLNSSVTDG